MYSSLHNHSEYSVLDGFGHPKDYLEQARKIELKAFAITEHGNQYSWVYFDKLSKEYPEIKMIYGVELYECFDTAEKDGYFHLIALAKNERGRIALNEIVTKSNFEGFYYKPRVDLNMLKPYANDLVISTACLASKIAREEDIDIAVSYVWEYKSIFPNFFLEMQSHDTLDQRAYNQKILTISKLTDTPFIITTDSHAATEEDLEYQSWHVRIARDKETEAEIYSGCYMQSDEEIHAIMDTQIGKHWVDIGLVNTNLVADLIEEVHMPWQDPQLPTFPLPDGFSTNTEYLRHLCKIGWNNRKFNMLSDEEQFVRKERMEYELGVIDQMGYSGYFLIVWDYIRYAKENDIIVGDGRGSGGGSIVVFLLGISELDPVANKLIFERFLNPERVSMPDIDVDFADRSAIISYLTEKYGEAHVCQILNVNYITPNVAIKDVGRVLGVPYSVTNRIASKFTSDSFQECLDSNAGLVESYAAEYSQLFHLASKISGRVRNVSMHAGGVCIFDNNVTDYMGMKLGGNDEHIIQADKKQVEALGGVKFDILGVKTLMVVQEAASIAGLTHDQLSINNPEFANDKKMYELLCSARTNAIFQTESQGMKDLLIRLQPSSLEDVSAVLALYRPDSMPLLEDFIHNKHHPEDQTYIHPDMKPILETTYGCMIYQEELMDVVRIFGGRSYGGADKFRKGIGRKDKELIRQESEKLYSEIVDNGYGEEIAKTIADDLSEKGGYLFNHSHSALYSVLTLKTAYLKAHYPVAFFCAVFNQKRNDYGALNKYLIDSQEFGVVTTPPHINKSERYFSVSDGKILFGLEAIHGIGKNVVDAILEERKKGKFTSFRDLLSRVSLTTANVVALIKAGAIPCKNKEATLRKFGESLYEPRTYKPVTTYGTAAKLLNEWDINVNDYKDGRKTDKERVLAVYNAKRQQRFNEEENERRLNSIHNFEQKYMAEKEYWEFEALSVFLSNNPFKEAYAHICTSFDNIDEGENCVVVGIISGIQTKKDKNKNKYAFINMNAANGLFEITCWSSQYKQYEDLIKRGEKIAVMVKKNSDKAIVSAIKPYDQWLLDRKLNLPH